jgi:hypothetical protein
MENNPPSLWFSNPYRTSSMRTLKIMLKILIDIVRSLIRLQDHKSKRNAAMDFISMVSVV